MKLKLILGISIGLLIILVLLTIILISNRIGSMGYDNYYTEEPTQEIIYLDLSNPHIEEVNIDKICGEEIINNTKHIKLVINGNNNLIKVEKDVKILGVLINGDNNMVILPRGINPKLFDGGIRNDIFYYGYPQTLVSL